MLLSKNQKEVIVSILGIRKQAKESSLRIETQFYKEYFPKTVDFFISWLKLLRFSHGACPLMKELWVCDIYT